MGVSASSNPFSCDPAIVQAVGTYLVSSGTITYADFFATLSIGFSCKINNVLYANTEIITLPIFPTLPDLKRIDFIVMNTENSFEIVQGEPFTDIIFEPNVPDNTVFVTAIHVFGDSVTIEEPIPGDVFVRKSEYSETVIEDTGDIAITLDNESTAFRLTGAVTSVIGFEMSSDFISNNNYVGKEIRFTNNTGADFPITHNGASTYPARFPSEVDFVLKNNETIFFKPVKRDVLFLQYCGVGRDAFSDGLSISQKYPAKYWHKFNGVTINDYGDNVLTSSGTATSETISGSGLSYAIRTTAATAGTSAYLSQTSFGRKRVDKGGHYVKEFFFNANGSSAFRCFSGIGQVGSIGNINPSVVGASLYGLMADTADTIYHFMYKVGIGVAVKIPISGWSKSGKKYFTEIQEHLPGTSETIVTIINHTDGLTYSATLPFVFEGAQKIEVNNGTDNIAVSFGLAIDELNTEL